MDTIFKQSCRLCLESSENVVNIFDKFHNSTIAEILTKHFWFEIHKNDGVTEWLCQTCWLQTKSFHEFYKQIELLRKRFYDSTERNVQKDVCGKDVTIDTGHSDAALEQDLKCEVIVKCEETEIKVETVDDDNSDVEDNTENILENGEQCTKNEQRDDNEVMARPGGLSSSEKIELEGQIRDMFNMKCEICSDVEFSTLSKAKQHYRKVHDTEGYITCCDKKFTSRYDIVRHIRYHNSPDAHRSVELDDQIREFFDMKCQICNDVELDTLPEVRRHYRNVHKTQGYITCCGRKFTLRDDIVKHVLNHINPDAYRCDECNKSFKSKSLLKSHIDNHVPLDSREFKCSLCPSSFNKECVLKQHVERKHISKTGEKFPCDKCGKNFRSSLLLSCHTRQVHELKHEYVCEVCARTFKNKQSLQNHVKNEHSSTPPPKVQCDVCGAWVKHLNRHRKVHEESKPLNCPICNKEIRYERLLRKHISMVHGEKRHQCHLCDKVFKRAKMLKEHLAIHTGEDLYSCPYCDKKFKSNGNMYSHRKKAHLVEWTRDFSKPKI